MIDSKELRRMEAHYSILDIDIGQRYTLGVLNSTTQAGKGANIQTCERQITFISNYAKKEV